MRQRFTYVDTYRHFCSSETWFNQNALRYFFGTFFSFACMLFNIFIGQTQNEKLNSFRFNETREKVEKEKCNITSEKTSLELGNQREFESSFLRYTRTHGLIHLISINNPIQMRHFQNYKHGYIIHTCMLRQCLQGYRWVSDMPLHI